MESATVDETSDHEHFYSIMNKHLHVLGNTLLSFGDTIAKGIGGEEIRRPFEELIQKAHSIMMQPGTCAALIFIVASFIIFHSSHYWLHTFARRLPFKLISRRVLVNPSTRNNPTLQGNEFYCQDAGIYAIQGRRPHMEDKFAVILPTSTRSSSSTNPTGVQHEDLGLEIFAIFDGHGGDTASIYAQKHLLAEIVKELRKQLSQQQDNSVQLVHTCPAHSIENQLERLVNDFDFCSLIEKNNLNQADGPKSFSAELLSRIIQSTTTGVDQTLCEQLKKQSDIAGTTALLAGRVIKSNKLLVSNVGDSRAVACDPRGTAVALSFDHKPNHPKEEKRIKDQGGFISFKGVWRVGGILSCSRAMGDFLLKDKNYLIATPDILTFDLNELKPKFVILASDGLWDVLSNQDAVQFVLNELKSLRRSSLFNRKGELAVELARRISLEAFRKGSMDNITVLIWLFDYESPLESFERSSIGECSTPVKPVRAQKVIREDDLAQCGNITPSTLQQAISPLIITTSYNARPLSSPSPPAPALSSRTSSSPFSPPIRHLAGICDMQSDKQAMLRLIETGFLNAGKCQAN